GGLQHDGVAKGAGILPATDGRGEVRWRLASGHSRGETWLNLQGWSFNHSNKVGDNNSARDSVTPRLRLGEVVFVMSERGPWRVREDRFLGAGRFRPRRSCPKGALHVRIGVGSSRTGLNALMLPPRISLMSMVHSLVLGQQASSFLV